MGFFDWLSRDEDPNQFVEGSIPSGNEGNDNYNFGDLWNTTKDFFDARVLKPVADYIRDPVNRETLRATVPGFDELEAVAGVPSAGGALVGMGMNLDMANPEKFRPLPTDYKNILQREAQEGLPTALEQVAPVDIATAGLGLAAKGATTIPRLAKIIPTLAKTSRAVDIGEALYGGEQAVEGTLEDNPEKIAMGVFRGAMGGIGQIPEGKALSSEVRQTERAIEPVEEAARIATPERGYPGLETAAPKPEIGFEPGEIPTENIPHLERAKELTTAFMETLKPQVVKALGDEKYLNTKIEYEPNLRTMVYDRDANTIYMDPELLLTQTPKQTALDVMHEFAHGPEESIHQIAGTETRPSRIGEDITGAETTEVPLEGLPENAADLVINAEEYGLTPLELENIPEPVSVNRPGLGEHFESNMLPRAQAGGAYEQSFLGGLEAIKNAPENVELSNTFQDALHNIIREARDESVKAYGSEPAKSYEENLADIRREVENAAPSETGAPKSGDIERNALTQYAKEQDARVKEASAKFQSAKTEAERSIASKEFQQAKAERDRIQTRITQLGGEKVVSEPVTEVTKPEPTKAKAETVEETPPSEKVVSAPANNLRRLLEGTGLTRFNINTLADTFKAKGLDVPEELKAQLPELIKELKDRGWVNEKIGGTYTLLTAPPKMLKGVSGGKIGDVTNLRGSLEESLKALGQEPVTEAKPTPQAPTPTSNIRPGQFHFDETGRKWEIRRVEGDQVTVTSGRGGGERTQVLSKNDILAKRGIMPERGAPMKEPTSEDINIDLSSLEESTQPPDLTGKEKITPDELAAIDKLFGTGRKRKGTSETPQEVLDAQKAALRGLVEKEKKGGENVPIEEVEGGPQRNFDVTLNDGTTHKVRATSVEEAQTKAEEVLNQYQSTKKVDKVEPSLTTLEKAAKYEIEPVKEAGAQISEQVTEGKTEAKAQARATGEQLKYQETLRKAQVSETKKLQKVEDQELTQLAKKEAAIRRAQTKEKFTEKPFTINLSNGRTVAIRARNENVAREIVNSAIKKNKSTVTVQGVTAKPSALDEAITGAARKVEETGFLQNPVVRVLNAVKSITFGGDVGHLLRQGKQMNADLLFSKHIKKVWDQVPTLWKLAKGGMKELEGLNERLYSDPDIKMMVDNFGMDMPGMGKGLKEEAFHGAGLAENLPVVGKHYVERSEAVYTGGLNFLRAAEAKKWIEKLKKDGFTPENAPEKYNSVARAVNIISQRGSFGPAYQKLFSDASAIYGAPRAKAARLQNAVELFRGGESGRVVRTTAAKTLAFNAGLYGLLAATTGAKFISDPEASDFGKIRINDKITVDPWVGLGVTARTVAKLVTGKGKSPYTGKEYPVTPSDALMAEFLGGIAPGVKLAWEAMSGKDLRGYQVDRLESLLNVAPLTAKSIQELFKEGDIDEAIELSILQFMGEGVDVFNYEESKAKQAKLRAERGLSTGKRGRKKKRSYAFD